MKPRFAATVSSVKMDWRTPGWLLDIARMASDDGQIALDPCTTADNPTKAKRFFTPAEDGLAQDWTTDGVLWCNPPYGRELKHWAEKWIEADADTKFFLCPARVDQPWFWDLSKAGFMYFLRKRVKFAGANTGAPFPNVVVEGGRICSKLAMGAIERHSVFCDYF